MLKFDSPAEMVAHAAEYLLSLPEDGGPAIDPENVPDWTYAATVAIVLDDLTGIGIQAASEAVVALGEAVFECNAEGEQPAALGAWMADRINEATTATS